MDKSQTQFLIDTNILIYALDGEPVSLTFIEQNIHHAAITPIIYIETVSYPFPSKEDEAAVRSLLEKMPLFPIDHDVMEQAIQNHRAHRIKLPDNLIAATAQVHKLTLVTRNLRDFQALDNVKLHNPFDHV